MSKQYNTLFCKTATRLTDHEPQKSSEFPHIPICCHDASHGDSTNNTNKLVLEYSARELFSYHQVHVILQEIMVKMLEWYSKESQILEPNNLNSKVSIIY